MFGADEEEEEIGTTSQAEWDALMARLEAESLTERPVRNNVSLDGISTMDDLLLHFYNKIIGSDVNKLPSISDIKGAGSTSYIDTGPSCPESSADVDAQGVACEASSVLDSDSDDGGWFTSDAEDSDFDPLEFEGREHYVSLGLHRVCGLSKDPQRATNQDIRAAWHRRARRYHPGARGGGRIRAYSRALRAYEVLRCPVRKAAYDAWADDARFDTRGEAEERANNALRDPHKAVCRDDQCKFLLEMLEDAGAVPEADFSDPASCRVLILLCGLCGRPSNLECWTCRLPLCEFCKLRPHWNEQHGVPLHYPLVDTHTEAVQAEKRQQAEVLAKQAKAEEDEIDLARGHEGILNEFLGVAREYSQGAQGKRLSDEALKIHWTARMSRYYRWGQDEDHIYVSVYNPLGGHARVLVDATRFQIFGGDEGRKAPPVIDRYLDGDVSRSAPIEHLTSPDGRYVLFSIPKAYPGSVWRVLFQGDPPLTSAVGHVLGPPALYEVIFGPQEALIRVKLEPEVKQGDVDVELSATGLRVNVAGGAGTYFERSFTWPKIDLESSWHACFDAGSAKAELEITVRNGQPDVGGTVGRRKPKHNVLFKEDVDDFFLSDMLLGSAFAMSDGRAIKRESLPPRGAALADTLLRARRPLHDAAS